MCDIRVFEQTHSHTSRNTQTYIRKRQGSKKLYFNKETKELKWGKISHLHSNNDDREYNDM